MKIKDMTCKEAMVLICENLGEKPDSPQCQKMMEMVEKDEKCRVYYKSLVNTIKCYKEYNPEFTDEHHTRLMEKLGLEE